MPTHVESIFTAAELYAAQNGVLPANVSATEFPPELVDRLSPSAFSEPPPIGGAYDWNGPGTAAPEFGVQVRNASDLDACRLVDQIGDDGDLNSGWITYRNGHLNFGLAPK